MKKKSLKINKETLANNSISEQQMQSVKGGSVLTPVVTITVPIVVSMLMCKSDNELA